MLQVSLKIRREPNQPEMGGQNDVDSMKFSWNQHKIDIILTTYFWLGIASTQKLNLSSQI